MESIKKLISSKKFLCGVNIYDLMMLDYIWKRNFSDISNMCEIKAIEKKTLILKPCNSVIKNEIFLRKGVIIKEINKYFNKKFIEDIKFIS